MTFGFKKMLKNMPLAAISTSLALIAAPVQAADLFDDLREPYFEAFKGKKVAFIPEGMGYELTESWAQVIREASEKLGFEFTVRDPNWSTSRGTQALTALLAEEQDIIVVHNPDVNAFARLLQKAEKQGVNIIQVNMKSTYSTNAYVGADWTEMGELGANELVKMCGEGSGTSGKVAIIQGTATSGASIYQNMAAMRVLEASPGINVVANQPADWDASKAESITRTILQQHPDLCGIFGYWDVMTLGAAAAVKEAGLQGKVNVYTNGGGEQLACDSVESGMFTKYWSYDSPGQGRDIVSLIKIMLQSDQEPGAMRVALYTPIKEISKENLAPGQCFTWKK